MVMREFKRSYIFSVSLSCLMKCSAIGLSPIFRSLEFTIDSSRYFLDFSYLKSWVLARSHYLSIINYISRDSNLDPISSKVKDIINFSANLSIQIIASQESPVYFLPSNYHQENLSLENSCWLNLMRYLSYLRKLILKIRNLAVILRKFPMKMFETKELSVGKQLGKKLGFGLIGY
jgi:hypothetical protein